MPKKKLWLKEEFRTYLYNIFARKTVAYTIIIIRQMSLSKIYIIIYQNNSDQIRSWTEKSYCVPTDIRISVYNG